MPRYLVHQPLARPRRGFTLVEVMIGFVAAGILAAATAAFLRAGMITYRATSLQNAMLDSSRRALTGTGPRPGLIWSARAAASVTGLQGSSVTYVSSGPATATFYLSALGLYRSTSSSPSLQAASVSTFTLTYYSATGTGLVAASTSAAGASLVTALVRWPGLNGARASYSGAALRNHP